jgi:SulP family sulfate permease
MVLNFIELFKNYKLKYLKSDAAAGISVAAISLPQVMAYAMIAGLNPVYGIYTFVISTLAATFTGTSSYMIVGPTNIVAVTIASTLNSLDIIGPSNYLQGVLILTFLTGIIQIVLTALKLGNLVNFVSDSVIQGLTIAVALIIAGSQLSKLLELPVKYGGNMISSLKLVILNLEHTNYYALLIGLITLAVILLCEKLFPKLPSYLTAILISVVLVYVFNWQDQLELVGKFESSIPKFNFFEMNWNLINRLWSSALSIAIIGFIQVLSIVKYMEKQTEELAEIEKEFMGQGITNIICSFFNGFAITGSFTKSFANYEAGAKTRISELISGLSVLLAVVVLGPIVRLIPISSLAVVVIFVAFKMIDLEEIKKNLKSTKMDLVVFLLTFITAIFTPRLDYAIYAGVIVSIIFVLKTTSEIDYSYISYEDQEENEFSDEDYKKIKDDSYIIINLAGIMQFNAAEDLRERLNKAFQEEKIFLIRMRDVSDLDMTMIEELKKFVQKVKDSNGEVIFSGVSVEIYELFENYQFIEEIGKANIFRKEADIFNSTKNAIKKAEVKVEVKEKENDK